MLERLEGAIDKLLTSPICDIENEAILVDIIASVGLFHDNRRSPDDPSKSIYGDDVRYMLPVCNNAYGIWQTPIQLASFMLRLKDLGIKTYLDIGTFSGWTVSLIIAFLKRYGIEHVDTFDMFRFCSEELIELWRAKGLPINYCLGNVKALKDEYDFVFIDGDHETGVYIDFENWKDRAKAIAFHDINDAFCSAVRDCWLKIKNRYGGDDRVDLEEFIQHPNNFKLMGIGLMLFKDRLLQ